MVSRLFIYGTLLLAENEFAKYLRQNSTVMGVGKLNGYLYDTGDYPAAIADATAKSFIHGSIVKLANDTVLEYLDPYEGYGEGQPQPYLFIREMLDIETESGNISCWVYLYNRPIDDFRIITSGDYLKRK